MRITRIYTGQDGQSHFADEELVMEDRGSSGLFSSAFGCSTIFFRETPDSFHYDWHRVERREYVIILEGGLKVEIGDGTQRVFRQGEILLVEDTQGQGHATCALEGQKNKALVILLD